MTISNTNVSFRVHTRTDTEKIVKMINRDPFHMLNGISDIEFEQSLDEPDRRIRDNTFVVEIGQSIVGYFSLSFVEQNIRNDVTCFGTVEEDWRRHGIGTAIFNFIFKQLEMIARQEAKPIYFKHRALTSIVGESAIGINFGMQEQNTLEIRCLKNITEYNMVSQSSDFQFRPPTVDDAKAWSDIYNEAFKDHKSIEHVVHEFQGAGYSEKLYLLCINEFNEPIGILSSNLRGIHARIPTIAVKNEWQRKGVGKALLQEILKRLKQSGAESVRLTVESRNDAAKSLYNKFGFQLEYKRIHYIATFLP